MSILLSSSELSAFKRCRRRWWFQYWRGLEPAVEKPGGALQLGTRIHLALAEFYTSGKNPVDVFDQLVAAERERYGEMEYPPDLTEFDEDHQLGRIMLDGYLEWLAETGADEDYEVVGVEQQIAVPLINGDVTFKGKLDIRVRRKSDGRRSFRDWKTTGSIQELSQTLAMNEQMLSYMLLERLLDPEDAWIESGLFDMLRKVKRTARAKPPFYAREEAYHSDVELRNYWKRLHGTIIDIMRMRARLTEGGDPMVVCYPTPTRDCAWDCAYVSACLLTDDSSNLEGLLESAFKVGDPYRRYDVVVG